MKTPPSSGEASGLTTPTSTKSLDMDSVRALLIDLEKMINVQYDFQKNTTVSTREGSKSLSSPLEATDDNLTTGCCNTSNRDIDKPSSSSKEKEGKTIDGVEKTSYGGVMADSTKISYDELEETSSVKPSHAKDVCDSKDDNVDTATEMEGKFWKDIQKSTKKGADLMRIAITIHMFRPESSLQKIERSFRGIRLLETIEFEENPLRRFLAVVRFYLSSFEKEPFDGKKPFNPILGERHVCQFDHGDEKFGITSFLSEQVSHHPPITAVHMHNKTLNITMDECIRGNAKFLGNSINISFDSERVLCLHNLGEEYRMTSPSLIIRGLAVGNKGTELVGHTTVTCSQTGYQARIHFKPIGVFGMYGTWDQIEGSIRHSKNKKDLISIHGHWSSNVYLTDITAKKKDAISILFYSYDGTSIVHSAKRIIRPSRHDELDSEVVWGPVIMALRSLNMAVAKVEKQRIEDRQRALEKKNEKYECHFFIPISESLWIFNEALEDGAFVTRDICD